VAAEQFEGDIGVIRSVIVWYRPLEVMIGGLTGGRTDVIQRTFCGSNPDVL